MSRPIESTVSVNRVGRLDGRTRIVATYATPEAGWQRVRGRMPFTVDTVELLRRRCVRSVELRRGFARARMPLAWITTVPQDHGQDADRGGIADTGLHAEAATA